MFGEITARNVYLIQITNIINCLMSDLLDVEKIPKVGNSLVLSYINASVF